MGLGSFIESANGYFVDLTQLHSKEVSLAFVATCLVLFGDNINSYVRRRVAHHFFLLRVLVFILLCAVGYGLLTITIHPLVHSVFLKIPKDYSFFFTVVCFIYLGFIAEKKRIM